jgi:DNA polymerase-3 subunit alpha
LGAVKGVGESALDSIIEDRNTNGPFQDLFELCQRIDLRKANKRVLEALIKSGALDSFGQERAVLLASLPKAVKSAEQAARNQAIGQADLFGGVVSTHTRAEYVKAEPWSEKQRLEAEKISLGLYLSGHPLNRYKAELNKMVSTKIKNFSMGRERSLKIAGIITGFRTVTTRKGDRMAIVTLDDHTGRTDIAVFPELYQQHRDSLAKDSIIVVEGEVKVDRFTGNYRFNTSDILSLEQARNLYSKGILISLNSGEDTEQRLAQLQTELLPFKGGRCSVFVDYQRDDTTARLNLGNEWRVLASEELLENLDKLLGPEHVQVLYA